MPNFAPIQSTHSLKPTSPGCNRPVDMLPLCLSSLTCKSSVHVMMSVHLDFMLLAMGKGFWKPTLLITSSGTVVSNLLPALSWKPALNKKKLCPSVPCSSKIQIEAQ